MATLSDSPNTSDTPAYPEASPASQLRVSSLVALLSALALFAVLGCNAPPARSPAAKTDALNCGALPHAKHSPLAPGGAQNYVREVSVDDLPGPVDQWEPNTDRSAGVAILVPAPAGVTRASLERHVLCYRQLARATETDPLLVPGSQVRVLEAQGSFEVLVTSTDAQIAEQVVRAARTLSPGTGELPESVAAR